MTQEPLFKELAAGLPESHQAEFYRVLHEAGISQNDVELARLLRALQLYKAYYESIPAAVQESAGRIERLKQEIELLSSETHGSLDAGAQLAGQVIQEAEKVRQDLTQIHTHVENALHESAENLAAQMAELLRAGIEKTVLLPLHNRLAELAESNQVFDDAIARSHKAVAILHKNADLARRAHLGAYLLGALLSTCSLIVVSWFSLHHWYADRVEQERSALVKNVEQNRAVLLELSRAHRSLELLQDPDNPRRKLLLMKNASGWQSIGKDGVIEFNQ